MENLKRDIDRFSLTNEVSEIGLIDETHRDDKGVLEDNSSIKLSSTDVPSVLIITEQDKLLIQIENLNNVCVLIFTTKGKYQIERIARFL